MLVHFTLFLKLVLEMKEYFLLDDVCLFIFQPCCLKRTPIELINSLDINIPLLLI